MANIKRLPQPPNTPPASARASDFVTINDLAKRTSSSGFTIRKLVGIGRLIARRNTLGCLEIYRTSAKEFEEASKARLVWESKRVSTGKPDEVKYADVLSAVEVAKLFDVAEETVRRHYRLKRLPGLRVKGRLVFRKSEVKAYKGFEQLPAPVVAAD
jgi:hypothetical protein